jgi:uncharacterized membrane protein
MVSGARNLYDQYDKAMNKGYLLEWIDKNQDKVQQAIDNDIISMQDVQQLMTMEFETVVQVEEIDTSIDNELADREQ